MARKVMMNSLNKFELNNYGGVGARQKCPKPPFRECKSKLSLWLTLQVPGPIVIATSSQLISLHKQKESQSNTSKQN